MSLRCVHFSTTVPDSSRVEFRCLWSDTATKHSLYRTCCTRSLTSRYRCDRNVPCSACLRHEVACVYNNSQPPRNRRKHLNVKMLTDQIRQYEALLRERDRDLENLRHASNPERRSPTNQIAGAVVQDEPSLRIPSARETRRSKNKAQMNHDPRPFTVANKYVQSSLNRQIILRLTLTQFIVEESDRGGELLLPGTRAQTCGNRV
jgi:hypothetical protein